MKLVWFCTLLVTGAVFFSSFFAFANPEQTAVLIVGDLNDDHITKVDFTLRERLKKIVARGELNSPGLSATPLAYNYAVGEHRRYCQSVLGIQKNHLPFLGIVSLDSSGRIPITVRWSIRVTQAESALSALLSHLGKLPASQPKPASGASPPSTQKAAALPPTPPPAKGDPGPKTSGPTPSLQGRRNQGKMDTPGPLPPPAPPEKSGEKEVAAISPVISLPPIKPFEFDIVTVDTYGEITERRRGQSQSFSDTLSEGLILEMVLIPGGPFQMGSPRTEQEREGNEGPQHSTLVSPFFLGKFEVTQEQWRAVAALPQVNRPLASDPSRFKGAGRPVENVTWYEAVEFCQRLSAKTGRVFRLPSEAEWEFACRAGTETPYHFGQTVRADLANYNGNKPYGKASPGKNREQTAPVGSFQAANPYGLYDMHGNVAEWCTDPYHKSYKSAPHDGKAWDAGGDDRYRIIRGGAWSSKARDGRSARRNGFVPGSRYDFVGFRVAISLPQGGK